MYLDKMENAEPEDENSHCLFFHHSLVTAAAIFTNISIASSPCCACLTKCKTENRNMRKRKKTIKPMIGMSSRA